MLKRHGDKNQPLAIFAHFCEVLRQWLSAGTMRLEGAQMDFLTGFTG